MNNDLYTKITGGNSKIEYEGIEHKIIQYVDDTNNVISSNKVENLQPYIDGYFKLIEGFYYINKLKINPENPLWKL